MRIQKQVNEFLLVTYTRNGWILVLLVIIYNQPPKGVPCIRIMNTGSQTSYLY